MDIQDLITDHCIIVLIAHCYYLNKKDRQMRFNNGGDPIYAIFDKIDSRPLHKIAKDFVKELADDSIRFISTMLK